MTSAIVDALCRMPIVFKDRGDISILALFRESGYNAIQSGVSERDIEAHLRTYPDLIRSWVTYSAEQRSSRSWYLAEPGDGLDGKEGWRVGHYTSGQRPPERLFPDEWSACAFFIMRYVEELSTLAG
jgi:hypothetical protein